MHCASSSGVQCLRNMIIIITKYYYNLIGLPFHFIVGGAIFIAVVFTDEAFCT